jgi:outer membrane protein OmpA-like peptidoglycan-associated protein
MPLQFQVAVQNPIEMRVTMDDLDLDNRRVNVHLSQSIARLDIDIFGETGASIGAATIANVQRSPAEIQWEQAPGNVVRLQLTATGAAGMSTTLDLFPWSYKIPHEEVIFPTGSAEILSSETHKLTSAKAKIDAVLDKFAGSKLGFEVPMKLYIAGYTDTVGNRVSNRLLSERRAASLAQWFRANGFNHPIHYQGFGENALAIQTDDEVDEPANRRALYVIAAETPPVSAALPTKNWTALR